MKFHHILYLFLYFNNIINTDLNQINNIDIDISDDRYDWEDVLFTILNSLDIDTLFLEQLEPQSREAKERNEMITALEEEFFKNIEKLFKIKKLSMDIHRKEILALCKCQEDIKAKANGLFEEKYENFIKAIKVFVKNVEKFITDQKIEFENVRNEYIDSLKGKYNAGMNALKESLETKMNGIQVKWNLKLNIISTKSSNEYSRNQENGGKDVENYLKKNDQKYENKEGNDEEKKDFCTNLLLKFKIILSKWDSEYVAIFENPEDKFIGSIKESFNLLKEDCIKRFGPIYFKLGRNSFDELKEMCDELVTDFQYLENECFQFDEENLKKVENFKNLFNSEYSNHVGLIHEELQSKFIEIQNNTYCSSQGKLEKIYYAEHVKNFLCNVERDLFDKLIIFAEIYIT